MNQPFQTEYARKSGNTPGRIGLKFDIFELMFYEILVMHIHNNHLVYNFYEQAIKLFHQVLHAYVIFGFVTFIRKQR